MNKNGINVTSDTDRGQGMSEYEWTGPECPHVEAVGTRPDRAAYKCIRPAGHTGGHTLVRADEAAE